MRTVQIHPIQQQYAVKGARVECGLCGMSAIPRRKSTAPRVTHLVHLVRHHLDEVNRTFSPAARREEITVSVEES